jgi:putative FmdB family regulatory protein
MTSRWAWPPALVMASPGCAEPHDCASASRLRCLPTAPVPPEMGKCLPTAPVPPELGKCLRAGQVPPHLGQALSTWPRNHSLARAVASIWQLHAASANAAEGGTVPTYQYACTDCAERLEVVQKFSDDPLTVCAACGGKLRKVFSPVGIVFKGSGFYRTDSRADRKSSEPAAASANGSDAKKSGTSSGSSGDSSSSSGDSSGGSSGDKSGSSSGDKSGSAGGKKRGDAARSSSSASSGSKVA